MSQSWRDRYFERVRPVVGQAFERCVVVVRGLGFGYLAAEALARTGARRQVWLDNQAPGGALSRSLGNQTLKHDSRGAALEAHVRDHNRWETGWQIEHRGPDLPGLRQTLARGPDLLLSRGGEDAGEVATAAVDAGVPLVMTFVPRAASADCLQVVWSPDSKTDPAALARVCRELGALPQLDLDRPENHTVGLQARSMALGLAHWILTRSRGSNPRDDLEQRVVQSGQAVLVRGSPRWPWDVRFLCPTAHLAGLLEYLSAGGARYSPAPTLLRNQRLLVLGLGTASSFCAEACHDWRAMVLVDAREVSAFNPVRQVYGTEHVGQPKAAALARILSQRTAPDAHWVQRVEGEIDWLTSDTRALGAVRLHLTEADPDAPDRFERLLDQVQPTLAIVGMGRTRDDNFLAADALRRRGIRHITPSAFPGVTHFKHILTDGASGPCYDCLQGHLPVDGGPGPTLTEAQRELFYGGTQPATLAQTYPSTHSLLELARALALPRGARPPYLLSELGAGRACFVGANRAERDDDGNWLYGVDRPFSMVSFGVDDVATGSHPGQLCACGRAVGRDPRQPRAGSGK